MVFFGACLVWRIIIRRLVVRYLVGAQYTLCSKSIFDKVLFPSHLAVASPPRYTGTYCSCHHSCVAGSCQCASHSGSVHPHKRARRNTPEKRVAEAWLVAEVVQRRQHPHDIGVGDTSSPATGPRLAHSAANSS